MYLHEPDTRDKTRKQRAHNMRRQLHLVWSVEICLVSTAHAPSYRTVIYQNIVPATRVLQKQIDQGSSFADGT